MSPLDLTPILLEADDRRNLWSDQTVFEVLDVLRSGVDGASTDWDGPDEAWARVLADDGLVALVHHLLPLVFLNQAHEELAASAEDNGARVVLVDDFNARHYRAERAALERLGWHAAPDAVDPEGFSAEDLWYATV